MKDNEIIDLLASKMEEASASAGWNYVVLQKAQPTHQGIPSAPTIFFEELFHYDRGWPVVKDIYNETTGVFDHNELQLRETTFQISAFVPQDVTDLTVPTPSDVVTYVKMFIKSRPTISAWMKKNVNVIRVSDVRNPYFDDDKNRFEANPNFDLTLTHNVDITLHVPVVDYIVGAPSPIPGDDSVGVFQVPETL